MVTVAGQDSASNVVRIPEVWESNQWVELPGAGQRRGAVLPARLHRPARRPASSWPASESSRAGSTWTGRPAATAAQWTTGPAHLWPFNRDYGSAVMYESGKILYVGGGGYTGWDTPDPKASAPDGHGGEDRSQRRLALWTGRRLDEQSPAPPHRDGAARRPGAGDRRGERRRLQRRAQRCARRGDLESGHERVDDAGEQRGQPRLPFGLDPDARRHRAPRRQRRRQHSGHRRPRIPRGGATRSSARPTSSRARARRSPTRRPRWATGRASPSRRRLPARSPMCAGSGWARSPTRSTRTRWRCRSTSPRVTASISVTAPANPNVAPPGHYHAVRAQPERRALDRQDHPGAVARGSSSALRVSVRRGRGSARCRAPATFPG